MNNYCRNCGEKLEDNMKYCTKCGTEVIDTKIDVDNDMKEVQDFKEKEKRSIIIIVLLYALAFFGSYLFKNPSSSGYGFFNFASPYLALAATITLIYSKITLKQSKVINIMFIILMIIIGLYILGMIMLMMICAEILNTGCIG